MLRETLFYFSWFVHYHEVPGKYFFFQWTLLQGAAFGVLALTSLVSLVNQFLSAFLFSCVVVAVIFLSRESATWQAQAALFLSSGCTFVIFWYSNLYFFVCAGCKCYFRLHFICFFVSDTFWSMISVAAQGENYFRLHIHLFIAADWFFTLVLHTSRCAAMYVKQIFDLISSLTFSVQCKIAEIQEVSVCNRCLQKNPKVLVRGLVTVAILFLLITIFIF